MRKTLGTILLLFLLLLWNRIIGVTFAQELPPLGIHVEELSDEERAGQIIWLEISEKLSSREIERLRTHALDGRFGGIIFNGVEIEDALHIKESLDLPLRIPLVFGYDCSNGFPRIDDHFNPPKMFVLASISDLKLIRTAGFHFGRAMKEAGMDFIIGPEIGLTYLNDHESSLGGTYADIRRVAEVFTEGLDISGLPFSPNLNVTGRPGQFGSVSLSKKNQEIFDMIEERGAFLSVNGTEPGPGSISAFENSLRSSRVILSPRVNPNRSIFNLKMNREVIGYLERGYDILRVVEINKNLNKEVVKVLNLKVDKKSMLEKTFSILELKERVEINKPINKGREIYDLSWESLIDELRRASVVVLDVGTSIPIMEFEGSKVGVLDNYEIPIRKELESHFPVEVIDFDENAPLEDFWQETYGFDFVVVNHGKRGSYGRHHSEEFLNNLINTGSTKFIHVYFNHYPNPFTLFCYGPYWEVTPEFPKAFPDDLPSMIISPDPSPVSISAVAEIIFGARSASGRLGFKIPAFQVGAGEYTLKAQRIRKDIPERHPVDWGKMEKISEIVNEALADSAAPGGQVLVLHKGMAIYENSFGNHTYKGEKPVLDEDLFDLASVTKVAGTMQVIMALAQWGALSIDDSVVKYLPGLRGTNKEGIIVRDVLVHQAGLQPYIPYWAMIRNREGEEDYFYCSFKDDWFCVPVADSLYTIATIEDSLWQWTINSDLLDRNEEGVYDYRYSDLSFYVLKAIAEKISGQPIEDFLKQNFWDPMGVWRMAYNPLDQFERDEIIPTEEDEYFRNQIIQGTVHDQGAALLGGVGGHAGMFSNGWELAKIFQMNLNGGGYGGSKYFSEPVITKFTTQDREENRRGLGWDKPNPYGEGPTSDLCSYSTFGHSGFTGTMAWADPEFDLVFVFLSNRTFPDAGNRKLIELNIRTRIQDIIYESIFAHQMKNQ